MIDMEQVVDIEFRQNYKNHYIKLGYTKPDANNYIHPKLKDVLPYSRTMVNIVCDYCGRTFQRKYIDYNKNKKTSVIQKDACHLCRSQKIHDAHSTQLSNRAEKAFDKLNRVINEHGYKLLTTIDEYTGVDMNIKFLCPIHGERIQPINNMIYNGAGCLQCANDLHAKKQRNSKEKITSIIEGTDNNVLLNPDDYVNERTRNLWIQCCCGNKYLASMLSFLNGKTRCSKCLESESTGERKIRQILDKYQITYIQEYCYVDCKDTHCLPFDFYLPDYNICIEFDGKQHEYPWFGQEAFKLTVLHDNIKTQYCKDHGIKLIRISYRKYKYIFEILDKELGLCKRNSLIS